MKLPKAEQGLAECQIAIACLIGAAEGRDFMMHARIGMLRALNRHVERVFNTDRKDPIGGGGSWRGIDRAELSAANAQPQMRDSARCHKDLRTNSHTLAAQVAGVSEFPHDGHPFCVKLFQANIVFRRSCSCSLRIVNPPQRRSNGVEGLKLGIAPFYRHPRALSSSRRVSERQGDVF
jgi:hypothetical protein